MRFDEATQEKISDYKDQYDVNQTEAIEKLVEVGYRESKSPLAHRLKDQIVDWVGNLGITAVMVFMFGATTPVLAIGDAALFSLSLVVVSILMLAIYELARVTTAMNELGVHVREVLRG